LEPNPHSPFTLLQELPAELDELFWTFSGIRRHFEIKDVGGEEEEKGMDSDNYTAS
jgi:hypothetical protein